MPRRCNGASRSDCRGVCCERVARRGGDAKTKDFPNPGVVDVYCNIHPEMAATILVLPNRRHVRVGNDGTFAIESVPPGKWTVFAYARRADKPVSAPVTVEAGKDVRV